MAFERRKFRSVGPGSHLLGSVIEYDANRDSDSPNGWKWGVCAVLSVAAVVSFVSARGCFRRTDAPQSASSAPKMVRPQPSAGGVPATNGVQDAKSAIAHSNVAAAAAAATWLAGASGRPPRIRTLLERLVDAERLGELAIAVDTIEKLRGQPSVADLDDRLARRLGDLNIRRLFSGEPVPWVVETTVRRGQTVHRIAREHGTTVAAVRQLNGLAADERPEAGRKLRVLQFPRVALVVHKQTRCADLTLGDKLFKRYYVSTGKGCKPGAYPITGKAEEGPRVRFSALDIRVAPVDMKELDMFLAPGSSLTISEM